MARAGAEAGTAAISGQSAPTAGQIVLGRRLQNLRESAGFTPEQAARALRVNATSVRRMEKAEVGLKYASVEKLLRTYGLPEPDIESFLALAEEANKPGWWHRFRDVLPEQFGLYVSLESAASLVRAYEPHCVPGLLQTEDYACALMAAGTLPLAPEERERRVTLRMQRQQLLIREPKPLRLWAVVDEAALRRTVGGPRTMRAQLDRLVEAARMPNVTLQVLPFDTGPHPAMYGPLHLLRFPAPELGDFGYSESLTGPAYVEDTALVSQCLEALNRISTQAPPAHRTEDIITNIRKEV